MRTGLTLLASASLLAFFSTPAQAQSDDPMVLMLERCQGGCTLTPGANNARMYQTNLIQTAGPAQVSEFSRGETVWQEVVECVRQVYEPFDVQVVEELPPPGEKFHMAIIAGTPAEVGFPPDVGGRGFVSCDVLNNQISISLDVWGSNVNQICATIAQESAHTFGLGHAFSCADPMTYLPLCGRAFFRDEDFQCGEFAAGDPICQCAGPSQNSHRWLLGKLGGNPQPLTGPVVGFTNLTPDQTVDQGFRIIATATDIRGIDRVEFWLNGTQRSVTDGPEFGGTNPAFQFRTPDNLADGYIDIEVKAYNDLETETIGALTVLKGAPCTQDAQCTEGPGQFCEDGRCKFPIATGELGDSCTVGTDCISGFCPLDGDSGFCSKTCDPSGLIDDCGEGFDCRTEGAASFCWPESSGGCGCTSSGGSGAPLGGLLLTLGVFLVLRRRRD